MPIVSGYEHLIGAITDAVGGDNRFLHLNAGLAILFLARLVTGRRLDTMVPLAVVIAAELLNEGMDRIHFGSWRIEDTAGDIFHTLAWPLLISLAAWARIAWPRLSQPRFGLPRPAEARIAARPVIAAASVVLTLGALLIGAAGIGANRSAGKSAESYVVPGVGSTSHDLTRAQYLGRASRRFDALDTDHDGTLSEAEAAAARTPRAKAPVSNMIQPER